MPHKVTVFGGSGFLGRYVVERLADRDAVVTVGVRRPEAAKFLRPLGNVGQVTPVAAPVQNPRAVAAAVAGADTVINLVGTMSPSGPQSFQAIHVDAAATVASAAAAAGARRLIHVSAITTDPHAQPAGGQSMYSRSKAAGETAVMEAFPSATIVRPSVLFGPEDHLFNMFGRLSRILPVIPLYGGGTSRFQPVYACDVAAAIAHLVFDVDAAGKVIELGGPEVVSFRAVVERILAATGRRRILLPLPLSFGALPARLMELLPKPMLTRDQLRQLQAGSVVSEDAIGFADLGMQPVAMSAIIPTYLARYRRGGRIGRASVA